MLSKVTLRAQFLHRRKSLAAETVDAASSRIAARVCALPVVNECTCIGTYIASMDNEVGTHAIVEWALAHGKHVLVPVCLPNRAMAWSRLRNWDQLAPSTFGVLEPRVEAREPVVPPDDSPMLVPGIAFDGHGNRIGYGAGYYDRFLAKHAGIKIGLAYEAQLADAIPREPHDIPMDLIVTEQRVIRCNHTGPTDPRP